MSLATIPDMNRIVGSANIVLLTLDCLRYDAAQQAWRDGRLKTLAPYLGPDGWERRHTPASFTFAAHQAFFAGFLPTPARPGQHPRLFAAAFEGSVTTSAHTYAFPEANLPRALAARGYRTICVGGTGFFNGRGELGKVLPGMFEEAHWSPELGVANRESHLNQVRVAMERVTAAPGLVFLFVNVAAIHQPNWFYGTGPEGRDTLDSHTAALVAVDGALAPLFELLRGRGPTFCIACSDHGEAYGEDGYEGHRIGHEVVFTVPYAEFFL